jgi:hypothetical protein
MACVAPSIRDIKEFDYNLSGHLYALEEKGKSS